MSSARLEQTISAALGLTPRSTESSQDIDELISEKMMPISIKSQIKMARFKRVRNWPHYFFR